MSAGAYEAFQYRTLLACCAAMGVPSTNVTGDLRQANYSTDLQGGQPQPRRDHRPRRAGDPEHHEQAQGPLAGRAAHRARGHHPRRRGAEHPRLPLREHARGREGTRSHAVPAQEMATKMDATLEHLRIGAIKGQILDADGSAVIYDLFTEFGVTAHTEIDFSLAESVAGRGCGRATAGDPDACVRTSPRRCGQSIPDLPLVSVRTMTGDRPGAASRRTGSTLRSTAGCDGGTAARGGRRLRRDGVQHRPAHARRSAYGLLALGAGQAHVRRRDPARRRDALRRRPHAGRRRCLRAGPSDAEYSSSEPAR